MAWVFIMFICKPFFANQFWANVIFCDATLLIVWFVMSMKMCYVSSPYTTLRPNGKSLTCIIQRIKPKTKPCGTPLFENIGYLPINFCKMFSALQISPHPFISCATHIIPLKFLQLNVMVDADSLMMSVQTRH